MHVAGVIRTSLSTSSLEVLAECEDSGMAKSAAPNDEIHSGMSFQLGPWIVLPDRGLLRNGAEQQHLEPMVMDVLLTLVRHQGNVVSKEQLVAEVWNGRFVADDAIVAKVAALRHKLGDDSKSPSYIETIPRRGYRLKMPVARLTATAPEKLVGRLPVKSRFFVPGIAALATLAIAAAIIWPPKPIESVAITEFMNLSDDPRQNQYKVDGFREELIISLSNVPGVAFIRSLAAGNNSQSGVDALVSGSVRIEGNDMRISVEIISADGRQFWARRFDGAADAIFDLQEQVATEVRDAILGEKGQQIRAASRPSDEDAYYLTLAGLVDLAKRDRDSLDHAAQHFEESISLDPGFGRAYLHLAIVYLLLADYDAPSKKSYFDKALEVANRGVEADHDIEASMGIVYGFVAHQYGQWRDAEQAFLTASRAPTIYSDAHHWYSRLLADTGRLEQSQERALDALDIDPSSQILRSRVAVTYLWLNDMPNAQYYFEQTDKDGGVDSPEHHFAYTLFNLREGDLDAARYHAKHAANILRPGSDTSWVDLIIDSVANSDDTEALARALQAVEQMLTAGADRYVVMTALALLHQSDRLIDVAFEVAESDIKSDISVLFLREFEPVLYSQDRFPELLDAFGLTAYWQGIGCEWRNTRLECS